MRRVAVVLAAALALASCSAVAQGTVTDKRWYDEYETLMPVWVSCGTNCTTLTTVMIYTPPCWQLFLKDGEETGAPCVEPDVWMRYEIGEMYP